ncbi:MAG: hypothetical protein K9K79_12970 [Desulfohalobiaceae bacterium]|nr:hypothetical protein [Desulfohalobiaceae bacterium]
MVAEQNNTQKDVRLNVWQTFVLGIKVLGGELSWNIVRLLRRFEIRQLEKRLAREYETLGRLQAGKMEKDEEAQEAEKELCHKQIAFLEKEIAFLEEELLGLRDSIVKHRREKWAI